MATSQVTVNPTSTERTKVNETVVSHSDTNTLKSVFPQSPIFLNELTADERRQYFKDSVLAGNTGATSDFPGGVNRSYGVEELDLSKVKTGGEGKPASAHVPNPVSPGKGSSDPKKQAAAPDGFGTVRSDVPFSGPGSKLDPKAAGQKITDQDIDDLLLGESGAVEKEEE